MISDRLWKDPEITGSDLKVWCALAFIDRGRGFVDSTDEAIADECGIAARTVRDSLARMERRGFLRRGRGEDGRRRLVLIPEGRDEPAGFRVIG